MTRIAHVSLLLVALLGVAGCSKPAEAPSSGPSVDAPAVSSAPSPTPAPQPASEPEPEPAVQLPAGLPSAVHVYAEIEVTEVNTLNADENQYEIKGKTLQSVVQVMNYYIRFFRENGWDEDMIMEHEGNTVVSFKKDGILQYIDSTEGGGGCFVTITTGNY
jgi:hypothetical protein